MLLIRCAGSSNPGAVAPMERSANSAGHDPEAVAMLVDNEEDQEEDCVIDMFQQSTMAVAEPKIAMQVMGISGCE